MLKTLASALREHTPRRTLAGGYRCNGKDCNASWSAEHQAAAVLALLTEEHGYQLEDYAEPDDPDEPHAWYPVGQFDADRPITHRRWASAWERVQ